MEKIKIQYTPLPSDYAKSIKFFKQKETAIGHGFVAFLIFMICANFVLNSDSSLSIYALPFLLILFLLVFRSDLAAWQMKKKASKQPQLLQITSFEADNDQIVLANELAESKLSWSVFIKALEINEYYFLIYAVNKNRFQFIPKRGFLSQEQENIFRNLLEQKIGKVENIEKGLRGWKLSLFIFGVLIFGVMGCFLLVLLFEVLL